MSEIEEYMGLVGGNVRLWPYTTAKALWRRSRLTGEEIGQSPGTREVALDFLHFTGSASSDKTAH